MPFTTGHSGCAQHHIQNQAGTFLAALPGSSPPTAALGLQAKVRGGPASRLPSPGAQSKQRSLQLLEDEVSLPSMLKALLEKLLSQQKLPLRLYPLPVIG